MSEQLLLLVRQVDKREVAKVGKYTIVEKDYVMEAIDPKVLDVTELLPSTEYLLLPSNEFITIVDAVKQSNLSRKQLVELCEKGVIFGKKIGKIWMVNIASMKEYLQTLQ
ncbi:MAG TPA: hypothetical protein VIN60_03880 [Anaerolineales bacterium]